MGASRTCSVLETAFDKSHCLLAAGTLGEHRGRQLEISHAQYIDTPGRIGIGIYTHTHIEAR